MTHSEIKKNIRDHLLWDDRLRDAQINVEYDDGVVDLSGYVTSHYARRAAENDTFQIKGVSDVHNNLNVKFDNLETPTDEEIKKKLKDAFYWNDRIDYSKIDVIVNNKSATLIGTVDAFWKIPLAEDLAYSVQGVGNVVNKLSAAPTKNISDESIAKNITEAIERNSGISPDNILVKVEDGIVTLEGRTNTLRQKKAIFQAAMYTKGVKQVINNINVITGL